MSRLRRFFTKAKGILGRIGGIVKKGVQHVVPVIEKILPVIAPALGAKGIAAADIVQKVIDKGRTLHSKHGDNVLGYLQGHK